MSSSPENRNRGSWSVTNRLSGGAGVDPALRDGLERLTVPDGFRQSLDPQSSLGELSRSAARFRNILGATPIAALTKFFSEDQRKALNEELASFVAGLQGELRESLNKAGIQEPDLIVVNEASSVKTIEGRVAPARFLVQMYLKDERERYLTTNHDGQFESSAFPISISFLGRLDNNSVHYHPFPAYSRPAFAELTNSSKLGPVLLERLSDGITSFVNQFHNDGQLTRDEYRNIIPLDLAARAVREGSGIFRVGILAHKFRFGLSLNETFRIESKFIEQCQD